MIVFDRTTPHLTAPTVHLDNEEGGFMATEHLLEQGYKRIAILAGPKNLGISNSRMDGYMNALKKYKLKPDPTLMIHCDFNQDYAFFATEELLAMKKRPDAIFTISDRMAIGASLAIKKKGLSMPDDIALVSFNNEPIVSLVTPGISSVEMPSGFPTVDELHRPSRAVAAIPPASSADESHPNGRSAKKSNRPARKSSVRAALHPSVSL